LLLCCAEVLAAGAECGATVCLQQTAECSRTLVPNLSSATGDYGGGNTISHTGGYGGGITISQAGHGVNLQDGPHHTSDICRSALYMKLYFSFHVLNTVRRSTISVFFRSTFHVLTVRSFPYVDLYKDKFLWFFGLRTRQSLNIDRK
jgi:hypothetical protein